MKIVDYPSTLLPLRPKRHSESEYEHLTRVAQELRALSIELNLAIIINGKAYNG